MLAEEPRSHVQIHGKDISVRKLFLGGIAVFALASGTAQATVVYSLNTINTAGFGPAPYASVAVTLDNPTTATIMFNAHNPPYTFGEMGLSVNSTNFSAAGLSFTLAPTSNQTPTFTPSFNGGLDGFGNFALDYVSNPNGFSASLISATFTLTDISGTWTSDANVLSNGNAQGFQAAAHVFNASTGGNSAFAAGGPTTTPVPEPATIGILSVGLLGLGLIRCRTS